MPGNVHGKDLLYMYQAFDQLGEIKTVFFRIQYHQGVFVKKTLRCKISESQWNTMLLQWLLPMVGFFLEMTLIF